jgi:hypothetical protein
VNLPGYEFLSTPLWLITTLHIVTLTLHLIAMNFLVGGIIVLLFGKVNDKWNNDVVKTFVGLFPSAMAATVTFGVAQLLFVQLVYHRMVYAAAITSAWFWLGIILVAIIAYYLLYAASFKQKTSSSTSGTYICLALIGFLYISIVYSSTFSLAESPDTMGALYASNQSGWVLNPEIGTWIFRWLHMILGAVTVGAFFIGWIGRNSEPIWQLGKRFYLWGMAAAMVVGIVYLMRIGDIMLPYMRSPAVWWLLVSIILSLGSLHFFFKKKFTMSGLMLFVSVVGMVVNRHYGRVLRLEDVTGAKAVLTEPVQAQWGLFGLFLLFFLIMVGVVIYMLKLFFCDEKK